MVTLEQLTAQFDKIDAATTAIAAELRDLREEMKGQGLTAAAEERILERLTSAATRLDAIGQPEEAEVIPPPAA